MHFDILVEDESGKKVLDILISKIFGDEPKPRVIAYKGEGKIPKNFKSRTDAQKRILLERLPAILRGYGKTFAKYPSHYPAAVIVVCDLDDRCLKEFRQQLIAVLDACNPKPEARFCIAVEEGEAWLLGDISAVKTAYPRARNTVLNDYQNDAICGTWEILADAVVEGGSKALKSQGYPAIGIEKSAWAENIAPHMDINNNASPSFQYFLKKIRELIQDRADAERTL